MASEATPLPPRQQRFVEEYLLDLNATQAAIRAGYSAKTADVQGSRLLGNAKVAAAIQAAKSARSARTAITQDWVLERLRENVERAMTADAVRDSEGNAIGLYTYQGAVANGALTLIGKHLGMFAERHEVSAPGGGPVQVTVTHVVVDPQRDAA